LRIICYTQTMNIKKILPSKKFIKVVGTILLIVIIIFLLRKLTSITQKYRAERKGTVVVVSDTVEKDTDGDGLKDWEEALWGTDINNPDSDGDGVGDSDQIRKIQAAISGINLGELPLGEDKTKTGALTRDILTIANALSQAGPLTAESQEAITNEIALENKQENVFTLTDITIIEKPTINQTRSYVTIMKKSVDTVTISEKEVQLIADFEKNMDVNNMSDYTLTGEKFKKERELIRKTPVPEQYISIHLQYINALEGVGSLYSDLGAQEEDPAKALAALLAAQTIFEQYQKVLELMAE
jgi:hypothetical protein